MDPATVGAIGVVALFGLIALGLPIGFSFLTVGFLGIVCLSGLNAGMSALARMPFTWITQYVFTCVPLFILMGLVIARTGIAKELFDVGHKWIGRLPGGLAMATTLGVGAFSAVSGSSTACAATMSAICYPEMKRKGYDDRLSTACIAAGGGIDLMIPPSLGFVIYGIITEQSIGKLLIAGIIPGILQVGSFLVAIYLAVKWTPQLAPSSLDASTPWREKIRSLKKLWSTTVLFVCTGNTCRSPLAEALCKQLLAQRMGCAVEELPRRGLVVLSAGLQALPGMPATPEAVAAAQALGASLEQHQSRPVTPELLSRADFVIGMTSSHVRL
ncbi:MAG: TRAP transporter large permease subunit, partial [candidate division WOR-3 bacterium]